MPPSPGARVVPPPVAEQPAPQGILAKAAYALGACGLALAAGSDGLAVAGRHLGISLLGSIELTQTAIVMLATAAMLVATLEGHHATVRMLTARLSPARATVAWRVADAVSALLFVALAAGTGWVLAEGWGGFEQTELLHVPIRWLRALWLGCALAIAAVFALRALFGRHGHAPREGGAG